MKSGLSGGKWFWFWPVEMSWLQWDFMWKVNGIGWLRVYIYILNLSFFTAERQECTCKRVRACIWERNWREEAWGDLGGMKFEGSRPAWCISSKIYSRDTPFWSGTLEVWEVSSSTLSGLVTCLIICWNIDSWKVSVNGIVAGRGTTCFTPVAVNCWPSESSSGCDVNIEYELEQADMQLEDVVISIPCP